MRVAELVPGQVRCHSTLPLDRSKPQQLLGVTAQEAVEKLLAERQALEPGHHLARVAVRAGDVDFSARSNFNGTEPRGHMRITFRDMDPDFVLTGEVTCLLVVGNTATLGSVITGVRGGVALGNGFSIVAVDSGKFSAFPDAMSVLLQTISLVSFTPGLPCNATTNPSPVTDGEIVVHDSLTG